MKKPEEESKSDGLEIVSVGSLYTGPWDKKYWSSSRGKDRYPYPVGFHALRTHNGFSYKMEIYEGSRGPIFQITSSDGESSSGQTPDITWEKFQRNGCSRVKLWGGKRFSCYIDGVEFFGFRNTLVQRLLRELVANANAALDKGLLVSDICYRTSGENSDNSPPNTCSYPDLLEFMEKPQVSRKRCRKYDSLNTNVACVENLCGSCPQFPLQASFSESKATELSGNIANSTTDPPSNKEGHMPDGDTNKEKANLYMSESIETQNFGYLNGFEGLCKEEPANEQPDANPLILEDSQINNDIHLCAPDTFDSLQEAKNSSFVDAMHKREEPNDVKIGTNVTHMALSETLVTGAHQEEESAIWNSNDSSEKNDFDSVSEAHEEIAKSMMTLLLPRALPLLTYSSRKKKKREKVLKEFTHEVKHEDKSSGSKPPATVASPGQPEMEVKHEDKSSGSKPPASVASPGQPEMEVTQSGLGPAASFLSVFPGSMENEQHDDPFSNEVSFSSPKFKAVETSCIKGIFTPQSTGLLSSFTEEYQKLSSCHKGEGDIRATTCPKLRDASECQTLGDGCGFETSLQTGSRCASESGCASISCRDNDGKALGLGIMPGQLDRQGEENPPESKTHKSISYVLEDQILLPTAEKNASVSLSNSILQTKMCQGDTETDVIGCQILAVSHHDPGKEVTNLSCNNSYYEDVQPGTCEEPNIRLDLNDMLEGTNKLIGCYSHPTRISSVTLAKELHDIYVCVSCGMMGERHRTLFVYQIPIKQPGQGTPSFMGYTSVSLPLLRDTFGNEIAVDKYGLGFSPDAQSLVLLGGIKAPHCRSQSFDCQCSSCASYCFEEIAVKIVQVKLGYVSVVVKLKAIHPILCLLVCEPDHLVAVDESGRLYLWVMNPTWSEQTEEYVISSYEYLTSHITELKRVPNSCNLVLGHNGYGDFSLWDIKKRTILSSFVAPECSVLQFLPVSLFSWHREGIIHGEPDYTDCTHKLMEATATLLSNHNKQREFYLKEGEDFAVWLLICTVLDSLAQPGYAASNFQKDPVGCWRLALLIEKTVILGAALDPRITAVGSCSGLGIIGTREGLVYTWELSTGTTVGTLHKFEGSGVSDIAVSGSEPASIAIAGESGQLLVYLQS